MRVFYKNSAPFFTDAEAWNIFRLAAFGEAVGWTLLISGILFKYFITPNNNIPVEIMGQIHGTLFICYLLATVVLRASLRWSYPYSILALLFSVPPYGTLVFEQYVARRRHKKQSNTLNSLFVRAFIQNRDKLLVVQPHNGTAWELPGVTVQNTLSAKNNLSQFLLNEFGIAAKIGPLVYSWHHVDHGTNKVDLIYHISNNASFFTIPKNIHNAAIRTYDEIAFIKPSKLPELQPITLQKEKLPLKIGKNTKPKHVVS